MQLMESIFREMPRYLDAHQFAAMTGLSRVTVHKKCPARELPGVFKFELFMGDSCDRSSHLEKKLFSLGQS